jgi:hypothetical protein
MNAKSFPAGVKIDHLAVDKQGVAYIAAGPDLYRMKP